MSIRSTLIVAAAIGTVAIGTVGPSFAQGFDNDSGNRRPSYYMANGARHMGRPYHERAVTPTQQNDWWWGGSHH